MRILITGGTGYVGRHVVAQCQRQGWDCFVATRGEIAAGDDATVQYDGTLASARLIIAACRPDCVIHVAAAVVGEHRPEEVETILQGNIVYPTNLLEAMREQGCRLFVNTASFWQHYEQAVYRPTNLYAASKQAFEDVLAHYVERGEVAAASLVLYDNYGPGDPRPKIVRLLVEAALAGTPLETTAGEQVVDLTHIDDVASAYVAAVLALAADPTPAAHRWFVSGERLRLADLAMLVDQVTGARSATLGSRPYRPREIFVPIPPGERVPEWRPSVRLVDEIVAMAARGKK